VGPQNLVKGAVVTDWIPYTATLLGLGNATNSMRYRRVGGSIYIEGKVTIGSILPTGQFEIRLPSGLSFASTAGTVNWGLATVDTPGTPFYVGSLSKNTSNSFSPVSNQIYNTWIPSSPFTWAAGNSFDVILGPVPIQGWSSNLTLSEDGGQRLIKVYGAGNAGGTITADVTPITFTTITDSAGAWNGSSFTAPETGDYSVDGQVVLGTGNAAMQIRAYVNGSYLKQVGAVGADLFLMPFSGIVPLVKGQILTLRTNITDTIVNVPTSHHIAIHKFSSPQTLAGSETVAARYFTTSAQSLSAFSYSVVNFNTKDFDTHNAVTIGSDWKFTAPTSGLYEVSSFIQTNCTAIFPNVSQHVIGLNGANETQMLSGYRFFNSSSFGLTAEHPGTATIRLNKGDYIQIKIWHNTASSTLPSTGSRAWIAVKKVGN
jgi:hypothetical protein